MHHNFVISPSPLHSRIDAIFKKGDAVTFACDDMTIEAVVSNVSQAILEPTVEILIARVNRSGPLFVPVKMFSLCFKKGSLILN